MAKKFDLLDTPAAGSAKEWRIWEATMRKQRPIAWFLQETLGGAFRTARSRLRDWKWSLLHRIHPKYRYHVVDSGLPPGYHDPCSLVLHVPFNLLKSFYERQLTGHVDWQADEPHRQAFAEMKALYEWWTVTRPNRENTLEPLPEVSAGGGDFFVVFDDDYRDHPEVLEWQRVAKIHNDAEQHWDQEDQDMLIRLVKIRQYLWD